MLVEEPNVLKKPCLPLMAHLHWARTAGLAALTGQVSVYKIRWQHQRQSSFPSQSVHAEKLLLQTCLEDRSSGSC